MDDQQHKRAGSAPPLAEPPAVLSDQPESRDQLLVYGRDEDDGALKVLRKRDDEFQLGQLRTLREGEAIHGEVIRLKPRADNSPVFDVDVVLAAPATARKGPAKVANEPYRKGWEAIFGQAKPDTIPDSDLN